MRTEYELLGELNDAREALRLKDDALTRMNTDLQTADSRVNDLREQAERLNREVTRLSSAPRLTVEDADPNSQRVRKELADLQSSLENVKGDLKLAEDELRETRAEQQRIQSKVESNTGDDKQSLTAIAAMETELAGLTEKWSAVYLAKLQSNADSKIRTRIAAIGSNLRALADQLTPVVA